MTDEIEAPEQPEDPPYVDPDPDPTPKDAQTDEDTPKNDEVPGD